MLFSRTKQPTRNPQIRSGLLLNSATHFEKAPAVFILVMERELPLSQQTLIVVDTATRAHIEDFMTPWKNSVTLQRYGPSSCSPLKGKIPSVLASHNGSRNCISFTDLRLRYPFSLSFATSGDVKHPCMSSSADPSESLSALASRLSSGAVGCIVIARVNSISWTLPSRSSSRNLCMCSNSFLRLASSYGDLANITSNLLRFNFVCSFNNSYCLRTILIPVRRL